MKVVAVSGSPRKGGNTDLLLTRLIEQVGVKGLEVELVRLSEKAVAPCIACEKCRKHKGECSQHDDFAGIYELLCAADAIVVGSPVYFGSATPQVMALLDRAGYVARHEDKNPFRRKIGAPVVVARRAGQNFTFAQLVFFFTIMEMIVPGSTYWTVAFGRNKGEVLGDDEALATVDTLADNIVWLLERIRDRAG